MAKLDNISVTIEKTDLPIFLFQFEFEREEEIKPAAKKRFIDTSESDQDKLLAESHAKATKYSMKWTVSIKNCKSKNRCLYTLN